MKISIVAFLAVSLLAGAAWAQGGGAPPAAAPPPAGAPDMSKMGPWSRKPSDEAAVKKEVAAFFKQQDELEKAMDLNGMLANIDFPVTMMTDDSKGAPKVEQWSRDQYEAMMKGMMSGAPKDMKITHKPTITVLSDSLVNVTDDFSMSMGKQKFSGKNMSVLIKRNGKWMWKVMGEAGWGDMPSPGAAPANK